MRRSSLGISPVVATVILVAIAIVIAIAVAFWASGLVGVFTRFEKIEIAAAYATSADKVTLLAKNTGSATATIDDIYVNGIPCSGTCDLYVDETKDNLPFSLTPGQSVNITLTKPPNAIGNSFTPGVTYEIAVHTASGKTYPAAVQIP